MGPYLVLKIYMIQPIGTSLRKKTLRPSPDFSHTPSTQCRAALGCHPSTASHRQTHSILESEWICCSMGHSFSNGDSCRQQVWGLSFGQRMFSQQFFIEFLRWHHGKFWGYNKSSVLVLWLGGGNLSESFKFFELYLKNKAHSNLLGFLL